MKEEEKQNLNALLNDAYEQFSDVIFRYCLFQTSNREKALDLTQDVFIKTWEYILNGKKIDNLKAFLYKVAKNLIIDYRRKKKLFSLDQLLESGFDVKNEVNEIKRKEDLFELNSILEIINDLAEKEKEILFLRFVEDISVKEIAKILKKSESNISVQIHRSIKKLKNILENK